MKIISKYKDYYDHQLGVSGLDEHIVLDRTEGKSYKQDYFRPDGLNGDVNRIYKLAICNNLYTGVITSTGRWYWGENIKKIATSFSRDGRLARVQTSSNKKTEIYWKPVMTTINIEENCPIVLFNHWGVQINQPMLKHMGIASIYPAEKIYNDLYNWISRQKDKDIKDDRDDVEKLLTRFPDGYSPERTTYRGEGA